MITGTKLPLIKEGTKMKKALNVINNKKLGVLIVLKRDGQTSGIITDGDLKRIAQKYNNLEDLDIKKVMKKNPITVDQDTLAASALAIMNTKKLHHFVCIRKKLRKQ